MLLRLCRSKNVWWNFQTSYLNGSYLSGRFLFPKFSWDEEKLSKENINICLIWIRLINSKERKQTNKQKLAEISSTFIFRNVGKSAQPRPKRKILLNDKMFPQREQPQASGKKEQIVYDRETLLCLIHILPHVTILHILNKLFKMYSKNNTIYPLIWQI